MTRLQLQLREAAEREAHGSTLGHALRGARWRLGSPVFAGAAAALVLLVAIGAGALLLRDDTAPAGPRVVATLELTGNPEQLVPAFGAVWIADPVAGDVVRVDPERRAVTARIPVGSDQRITMQPVGSELWAIGPEPTQLLRIDPRSNRVTGRIRLRAPAGRPFPALDLLASDRAVWAVGPEGALRVDARTGAGRRLIATPTRGNEARWVALGQDALWVYGTDGAIRRFDPLSGAARGRIRPELPGTEGFEDFDGDLIAFGAGARVARMDGRDGAVRWERAMADRIHTGAFGAGLTWLYVTRAREGDRLVALDPRDGAVAASLPLDGFGASGMAVVGDEVWINQPGGDTVVVGR